MSVVREPPTAMPRAVLARLLDVLLERRDLSEEQASAGLDELVDPECSPALKSAFLTALRMKGETPAELAGLARAMRARALGPLTCTRPLVDTCGTGGDASGSFNLSTAAALVAASAGVRVAKHGNRAVSSRAGSADLAEALGIPLSMDAASASRRLDAQGFAFLFAPAFHAAAAAVAEVRRTLAVRTAFNLLGPLVNPALPERQLVGACDPAVARLLAGALGMLGIERAFVVHGEPGWDEATPVGPFLLVEVRGRRVEERVVDPLAFGIPRTRAEDLLGEDAGANAQSFEQIASGVRGPLFDAVVLNAALVLLLVGRTQDPRAAARHAEDALASGRTRGLLAHLRVEGGSSDGR